MLEFVLVPVQMMAVSQIRDGDSWCLVANQAMIWTSESGRERGIWLLHIN